MADLECRDPNFEARVRASFAHQNFMAHIGAEVDTVALGHCTLRLPYSETLTQQHGFYHGGAIGTLADVAGGYAAQTTMAAQDSVLTVEYKLNIMAPGKGQALIARGDVIKSGRTLVVTRTDVFAVNDGQESLIASGQQTLMRMVGFADNSG